MAWGGFFLTREDDRWRVVDDEELPAGRRREGGTIGVQSASYGDARLEVLDESRHRLLVGGRPWAGGERWDWGWAPTVTREIRARRAGTTTCAPAPTRAPASACR